MHNDPQEEASIRILASAGDVQAQLSLGLHLMQTGRAADTKEAYRWFTRAAAKGSAAAVFWKAACLLDGVGVVRNEPAGIALLSSAVKATPPYAPALTRCAALSLGGAKVGYTPQESLLMAQRALALGDDGAHLVLARCYALGHGTPQDYRQAHAHAGEAVLRLGTDEARTLFARISERLSPRTSLH